MMQATLMTGPLVCTRLGLCQKILRTEEWFEEKLHYFGNHQWAIRGIIYSVPVCIKIITMPQEKLTLEHDNAICIRHRNFIKLFSVLCSKR